jgi:hypothetical protein
MTTSWWDSSATFKRCTFSKVSFLALCLLDLALTLVAMSLGFAELNPMVGFLLEMPALLIFVKGVLPVLFAWLFPGRLLWLYIPLLAAAAIWNAKELIVYLV